jgi:hypothetical protein
VKTFVVLAVSTVLVNILFCPIVMAAPAMPDDVQIVQPDPSLPKELSVFFGKWEGADSLMQHFLIVEKINEEKASLYWWQSGAAGYAAQGWVRYEAKVSKERGKYILWFPGPSGIAELTLKGEYLDLNTRSQTIRPTLRRVP